MRPAVKRFVKLCSEVFPALEPMYEFGALQVPGQEGFADLRPFFPAKKYIGADMRPGTGVDCILNLHAIDLPEQSAGTVLALDTLEHVEYPHKAIEEITRILKPNGLLIISSTLFFPIHDYPHDYWRFTPEAFKSLMKPLQESIVVSGGNQLFPHTIAGVGCKGAVLHEFMERFQDAMKKENPLRSGLAELIEMTMPVWLWSMFRTLRKPK